MGQICPLARVSLMSKHVNYYYSRPPTAKHSIVLTKDKTSSHHSNQAKDYNNLKSKLSKTFIVTEHLHKLF